MADGSLLFDTKLDESGLNSGLSSLKKTIAALGIGKMMKDVADQVWNVGSSFETSFSKASTLFGDVSVDTVNLKNKIADMSKQTGISAEELNETLYQAMSAGIPVTEDMATALSAVQTAAKLSVGGFTSSSTAMSGLTTAINAYGLSADDASRIADEFIMVQNKGVTTVDELASNMGRAISTGSAFGVNLENLNASYISLTKGGISTAEATTYLSSMMNELGDSGSNVGAVLQEKTGMSFSQLMENGYSLADVLDILMDSVNGDSSALMNLWGSAEAGKAANAILTQGTDNFRQSLDELGNSSGTTEDAYSTMMDTADAKMKQVKQTANDLFIKIFEKAEPVIMSAFDAFGYLLDHLNTIAAVVVALAAAFAGLKAGMMIQSAVQTFQEAQVALSLFQLGAEGATVAQGFLNGQIGIGEAVVGLLTGQMTLAEFASGALAKAQGVLNAVMSANPIAIIIMLLAALVVAFIVLWNKCDGFREFWIDLWNNIKEIFFSVWDTIKSFFTEKIPEMFNNLMQWFKELPDNIAYWLGFALGYIIAWCILLPEKAKEAGKNFLDNVTNFFKNLPSNIATWLLNALVKVIEWRLKLQEKGAEAAKALLKAVVDGLKNIPHEMASIGGNIVKGLWNGIQNMIGWFKDRIHSFFSGIVDGAKSVLGIHSPSKKFAWIGKMCIEGFEDPFDDYDPYKPFNDTINANIGTMQANAFGNGSNEFDYSQFADATVDAFERAGFVFKANNRELGRFVRGASMA